MTTTGLLQGRCALVTGAASGIGRATVERFRSEGARVVGADLAGADITCDVTDEQAVAAAFDTAERDLGGVDIAVANAGIVHTATIANETLAGLRRVLDVNLIGVFLVMREAARRFPGRGGGVVLATASQAARHGYRDLGAYCASKFAVVALTETLAKELAPHGVRVCCVAPAIVDTPMQDALQDGYATSRATSRAVIREAVMADVPTGRAATADEVARVFAFLASDYASYLSGVTVPIDAGEGT
jgi:NAD(P)-dependent dehydrogenase (short-subunit alcohol dehydrogenase family)